MIQFCLFILNSCWTSPPLFLIERKRPDYLCYWHKSAFFFKNKSGFHSWKLHSMHLLVKKVPGLIAYFFPASDYQSQWRIRRSYWTQLKFLLKGSWKVLILWVLNVDRTGVDSESITFKWPADSQNIHYKCAVSNFINLAMLSYNALWRLCKCLASSTFNQTWRWQYCKRLRLSSGTIFIYTYSPLHCK